MVTPPSRTRVPLECAEATSKVGHQGAPGKVADLATIVTALIEATPRMPWIAVATRAIDEAGMNSMIVNRATRCSAAVTASVILQHDLLAGVIKDQSVPSAGVRVRTPE